VTKRSPVNIAASIHARLRNVARERGRPFDELLNYYVMERFLYRLSRSAHADKFILKGALMFVVWEAPLGRPTSDIDLLGRGDPDPEAAAAIVRDVCRGVGDGDGLTFDPSTVEAERTRLDAEYDGVRVKLRGNLGTARVSLQLDIGFGDAVVPPPVLLDYPVILDLPGPRLRGYVKETVVAEKFEAMVALGQSNSRMKDFYDVWFLSRTFDFDGGLLASAIGETFKRRTTDVPAEPLAFGESFATDTDKVTQWNAFTRRMRLADFAPCELKDVVHGLGVFLGPIARALSDGKRFDDAWVAPGPWKLKRRSRP
jgi:predicted nucleotidyltransferase component of viral defense system